MKTIVVKGTVIGGEKVCVCVPLAAKTQEGILEEAVIAKKSNPDIMEWRADYYENATDGQCVLETLNKIRDIIRDIPLMFTLRIDREGGYQTISMETRKDILLKCIQSSLIDFIDVELINGGNFLNEIIKSAKENNCYVILSYHNFNHTPEEEEILSWMSKMHELGADIAKVSVMPENVQDVLTLLSATAQARKSLEIPVITMSMGKLGAVSRIGAEIFGSCITFGVGKSASAPGQFSVDDLQKAINILR